MDARHIAARAGLSAILGFMLTITPVDAAEKAKPVISEEASAALMHMGQTLQAKQFSFQARTIRVYADDVGGDLFHIFHTMKVTVRRPDKLVVDVTGDDGSGRLGFDGKTFAVFSAQDKKYASLSLPDGTSMEGMLKEVVGRYAIDFPLADFLSEAPNKAFLTGVTAGRALNTVTIDGVPYLHLFFSQPPGIELELWVGKDDKALPRRLIVTYRNLPGQPNFIAEFADWNFNATPPDAEFAVQPPADAVQAALKPASLPAQPGKGKGAK